jgi:hypothetical protein
MLKRVILDYRHFTVIKKYNETKTKGVEGKEEFPQGQALYLLHLLLST